MGHRYRVTGDQPLSVDGKTYGKGDEFSTDEFTDEQEQQLIEGGAIEPFRKVDDKPSDKKEG
jgi:hypothetical protein